MSTGLVRTWADSGIVAVALQASSTEQRARGSAGVGQETQKPLKVTPRHVFDILVFAHEDHPGQCQFAVFCSMLRRILHGVPVDLGKGGPCHALWRKALLMYGKRQPKMVPAIVHKAPHNMLDRPQDTSGCEREYAVDLQAMPSTTTSHLFWNTSTPRRSVPRRCIACCVLRPAV